MFGRETRYTAFLGSLGTLEQRFWCRLERKLLSWNKSYFMFHFDCVRHFRKKNENHLSQCNRDFVFLPGYGKMAPNTVWGRIFCIFYAIFGIPITGLMLKSIGERITETTANFWKFVDSRIFNREPRKIYLKTVACIFIMVTGMILFLAGIGKSYEGWTFFEGVYFAFITLSTIGFGDFVPQHPSNSEKDHPGYVIAFTVLTFVYFTFGLAVVSSALLAISRLFEDEPPWGFISLMGGDDGEDDESENLLREKKKAQAKAKMAESSGP